MDGNGRWAQRQGLPRIEGHRRGVASVRRVTEECARLGIEQLTLYCLSSENWKRPQEELEFLMQLLEQYMIEERSTIMEQDISVRIIGRREGVPPATLAEMDKTIAMTANNRGTRLCLAVNYGACAELLDAVRRIVADVQAGRLDPAAIDRSRDRGTALYGPHARPRSADSHGRRNADQQFSALADQLCRDLGDRFVLAGVPGERFTPRDRGVCEPRASIWRSERLGGNSTSSQWQLEVPARSNMLRWRLLFGALFIAALAGLCWLDGQQVAGLPPGGWLFPLAILLSLAASGEMLWLFGTRDRAERPLSCLVYGGNLAIVACNVGPVFWPHVGHHSAVARDLVGPSWRSRRRHWRRWSKQSALRTARPSRDADGPHDIRIILCRPTVEFCRAIAGLRRLASKPGSIGLADCDC